MSLISTSSIEEAKKLLKKEPLPHIVQAQSEHFNRTVVESGLVDILVVSHHFQKKDSLRALDTGISLVLLRIATKKDTAIGINLQTLRALAPKAQALDLARLAEIIRLAHSAKTKLALSGARGPEEKNAFLQTLGASSQQAVQALTF